MKTLIFLLLTSISIFAQKEKQFLKFSQNVLDEQLLISLHHNFSGNVKSIIEKTFSLDTSINNIGVVESVVVFDSLGNLLQTHNKSKFFSCEEHCFYSYDSKGRIIKHEFYTSKNELYEKGFYKYNRVGLLLKICVKKRFGLSISKAILINKYDKQDRLIESIDRECGLVNVCRTEFKYNSNNQLVEEISYYDNIKSYSYFFKYNKEGRISEKKYSEFEKFDSIDNNSNTSYKYNENGDLIEIKCLNFLNETIYCHEYVFLYYKQVNKLKYLLY